MRTRTGQTVAARRVRRRAGLHFPAWLDGPPVEQARLDEMEDMALAGEMLDRMEERKRAEEAHNLARLLRRSARK